MRTIKTVLIRQRTHPSIARRSPLERIAEAIKEHNPGMIVAPEYFLNNEQKVYSREEKNGIVKKICDISGERLIVPGTILWQENGFMYDRGLLVSGGKVIAEHDKSEDGGEGFIAKDYRLKFAAGTGHGSVAKWNGLDVGLEICAEHGCEALKKRGKRLDIQIVVSHGEDLYGSSLRLRKGGYAILSEGRQTVQSEIRKKEGWIFPPRYRKLIADERDNALVYEIEIYREFW